MGLLTVNVSVGVLVVPRGWSRSGPMARLEIRPELPLVLDGSAGVVASMGVGHRWATDARHGRYVLLQTEAGPAWIPAPLVAPPSVRREDRPTTTASATTVMIGVSVALGMDW